MLRGQVLRAPQRCCAWLSFLFVLFILCLVRAPHVSTHTCTMCVCVQANRMIENVVGSFPLPLAFATNFRVNGKDYLVPMVIEEASVVAAASNSAKLARAAGACGGGEAERERLR